MHATSHCLIVGVVSFVSGLLFFFHLASLYYLTERVLPPQDIATNAEATSVQTYTHAAQEHHVHAVPIIKRFRV